MKLKKDHINFSSKNRVTIGPCGYLAKSIKNCGVINPVIVCKGDDAKFEIIAGHRRAEIFFGIDASGDLPCFDAGALQEKERLEMAVSDNFTARRPNPVEIAVIIDKLSKFYSAKEIADRYFDMFGIQASEHQFKRYSSLISLCDMAKEALAEGWLPVNAALHIVKFDGRAQELFVEMTARCRMGANISTEMAENISEASMERGESAFEVLEYIGVHGALSDDSLNSNEKTALLRQRLLNIRRPEYESRLKYFHECVKNSGVTGISINQFPYFEKDELNISFSIRGRGDIELKIKELEKLKTTVLLKEFTSEA
ncbi:MAG TPA: ParB N-terminal domain-containing protein [Candidatus Wallbacteria bacterium]|nr:ParB N-terminal domain-containing protein [Candidatus Wallbacteria bacterium]